jgi:nitroreductase
MDAIECIATRRSIRRFLNTQIDQEKQMTIVEAGSRAPSAGNVQDWRFVVVDDKDLMKKICEHSMGQDSIYNAAFLVVVCADPEITERHYGLRGERLYTIQNCSAAIQNMLLAAHALGIGGVWIGAFDEIKLKFLLNIPESVRPQAILAFGYADETPDRKIMKDLSLITFFNSYGNRVKDLDYFLRDYSVDWQKRINQAHTFVERVKEKAEKNAKEAGKKLGETQKGLLSKYKEKFSKK